jgi:hypothetical protein
MTAEAMREEVMVREVEVMEAAAAAEGLAVLSLAKKRTL